MRQAVTVVAVGMLVAVLAPGSPAQGQPADHQRAVEARPPDQRGQDGRGGSPRGPVKWWEAYRAELRLTPDQVSRITAIFDASFPQLRASYEELNKREEQLSALISANDATEAQVLRQADQIESIRGELSKTRVLMLFRMRRVLSADQRNKLQELQKERERDRGGPPPGRR
jgi:Spy/CpxP family protein refolding chaperone